MVTRPGNRVVCRNLGTLGVCLSVVLLAGQITTAGGKRPITNPKYDPSAEKVKLFDGIDQELIGVRVVAANAQHGNLLIENLTDKPITVELPKAVVGVQVLEQFGGGGGVGGGLGGGIGGGLGGGMGGGAGGGGQSFGGGGFGGGAGGAGGIGGGMGGGGGGLFSIPPERIAKVSYKAVCLEHGKADPTPRMHYQLVPVDQYTDNPILQELLNAYGTNRIDPQAVQAAAWYLSNGLSWQELASKRIERLGGLPPLPYFSPDQIAMARQLVSECQGMAREKSEKADVDEDQAKDKDEQPRLNPRSPR